MPPLFIFFVTVSFFAKVLCLFICIFFFSFVSVARFCQWSMHLDSFFSFFLCLWLGLANPLCLFIYIFISLLLWQSILVFTMFYASLFIVLLSYVSVSWFCHCSMPLTLYLFLSFLSVSWFCQSSMPLYLNFIFTFVPVARLCQCSMPLYLYCFLFLLCVCINFANILCLFSYIIFLSFVSVSQFCQCSNAS